jgi:phage terminase small subunit
MGQTIAHPLITEIRKCEDTIRKCLSVLGFSPADRARLGLAEAKAQTRFTT